MSNDNVSVSASNSVAPRKRPTQERSRKRVAAIIEATRQLVGERGNDGVSTREIAAKAGIPISSLYQYFPDKNAILRQLMLVYMGKLEEACITVLHRVHDISLLPRAIENLVHTIAAMFEEDPAFVGIWSAVQANPVLREWDILDSRQLANSLTDAICELAPELDRDAAYELCWYATWVAPNVVRVAHFTKGSEGDCIVREFQHSISMRLKSLLPHVDFQ